MAMVDPGQGKIGEKNTTNLSAIGPGGSRSIREKNNIIDFLVEMSFF